MSGGKGKEMRLITMTAVAAVMVAGCTTQQPVVTSAPYDPVTGVYWTSVMGTMDTVGSDRQTGLCHNSTYGVMDERRGDHCEYGHGSGTLQGFMTNLPTAMGLAAGPAMEGAFLRPSNFNVSNNSNTSGGSIAPGAAAATASPVTTAAGGAGGFGQGGRGGGGGLGGNAAGGNAAGGNATGGNATGGTGGNPVANANAVGGNPIATASPTVTASPVVTANPVVSPTVSATASPRITTRGGNTSATASGGNANAAGGAGYGAPANPTSAMPAPMPRID